MKKTVFAILVALWGVLSVQTAQAKTYVFAAIEQNPYQNAMSQVLKNAFTQIGHELIITPLPSKRALLLSNLGHLDGEVGRVFETGDKHPKLKRLPIAIGHFKATAITIDYPQEFTDFSQFKPYKLGIMRGIIWSEKASAGYQRMIVDDLPTMIRMLKVGRFDYGLGDHAIFTHIKNVTGEDFHILEPPIFEYDLFPYVHIKNADLIAPLSDVLKKMRDSGDLNVLLDKYFTEELRKLIKF